jgi:hypothetical protein
METYEELFKVTELTPDQQQRVRVIEGARQKASRTRKPPHCRKGGHAKSTHE